MTKQTASHAHALADFVADFDSSKLPSEIHHEAKRGAVNWFALVRHAKTHPTTRMASAWAASQLGGQPNDTRMPPAWAALVNGTAAHAEDYDDTCESTILHIVAPVFSAAEAQAHSLDADGGELLAAFALGGEVAQRLALAVFPEHYDRGHHITATAGAVGAAAAVGRLLRLDAGQLWQAFGLAGAMCGGVRGTFGSDAKPLQVGNAALIGLQAANLAAHGAECGRAGITDALGFGGVLSPACRPEELDNALGVEWRFAENAIKGFACGVVAQPAMTAALDLRARGIPAENIKRCVLKVHPRVLQLTGNREPVTGLQGKFSVYHSFAAVLLDGKAGPGQYTDERVRADDIKELIARTEAESVPDLSVHAAVAEVELADGNTLHMEVREGWSSGARKLTDSELEAKALDLLQLADAAGPDVLLRKAWDLENIKARAFSAGLDS